MGTQASVQDRDGERWPDIPYAEWRDSCATLHLWTQIVGKIRLAQTPWLNHSWHVALYLTARGLTTSPIPCGARIIQIDFDFIDHQLLIETGDGDVRTVLLAPRSVADFQRELFAQLADLGLPIRIHGRPNEVADPIPFAQDERHAAYDAERVKIDAERVNRFWRALAQADRVLKRFRDGFIGKSSPVHFFWGSFDLALTRFSGRPAPPHPGGVPNCPDWVTREAYSHEVASCGFWPGNDALPWPAFYAYAYPEPPGYGAARVRPGAARYDAALREFLLPYDEVRRAAAPDETLLAFLQDGYEAAANLGRWDRAALERHEFPFSGQGPAS
ncbi:MAG TPA: DUF5996 family protein [Rhodocyclaceae bacterium]